MQRRELLRAGVAVVLGSNRCLSFNATAEMRLKIGDSDTPVFPFRGGRNNWWGYVDETGRVMIDPEESHIRERFSDFYAGLCAVHFDDGSAWMIDTKGAKQFAIYPDFDDWNYVTRNGLMPNRHRDTGKWGYVDRMGAWVIGPKFDFAFPFSQQRAVVSMAHLRGVINSEGRWVLAPSLSWADGYKDGLLCIRKNQRFAYLDLDGKPALNRDFEQASQFSHGLAVVREHGRSYVIDTNGKVVVPPRYEEIWLGDDYESPTLIKENGSFGVLLDGKVVYLPKGQILEPFSCSQAIVQDDYNGLAHFIGPKGNRSFGTSYWRPEPFVLQRAAVQFTAGGDHAWIDLDGNVIFRWQSDQDNSLLKEQIGLLRQ